MRLCCTYHRFSSFFPFSTQNSLCVQISFSLLFLSQFLRCNFIQRKRRTHTHTQNKRHKPISRFLSDQTNPFTLSLSLSLVHWRSTQLVFQQFFLGKISGKLVRYHFFPFSLSGSSSFLLNSMFVFLVLSFFHHVVVVVVIVGLIGLVLILQRWRGQGMICTLPLPLNSNAPLLHHVLIRMLLF